MHSLLKISVLYTLLFLLLSQGRIHRHFLFC
ncbi:hypothetical protein E2C01_091331 [Portunus trituberculatus]|uniref:Uncharacterized protein n=1 Tax=Portunus trituberculatus TaxID=210409 RepID=A0A5B7JNS0_PORTR|nr:hypothetical protein [Portunus trituberculatus]